MFVVCSLGFVTTQSSKPGRGSPTIVPVVNPSNIFPFGLAAVPFGRSGTSVAPDVFPAIKLRAPGVEGPKVVLKELSLIAKGCTEFGLLVNNPAASRVLARGVLSFARNAISPARFAACG